MNNNQFHEAIFGSQWPPDQHGGHSAASTMLHPHGQTMPQGMMKREPGEQGGMSCPGMGGMMHDVSGSVADSTSPPPGSEGMFGGQMASMFVDKKGANSIRGNFFFFSFCLDYVMVF